MTDILDHLDVHVRCSQCGEYTVSAAVIAESQRLLEEGCPGSPHECPPQLIATLAEPEALESLSRAWHEVEGSVQRRADSVRMSEHVCLEFNAGAGDGSTAHAAEANDGGPDAGAGAETVMFKSLRTQPSGAPADLVDLLLECHDRIRSFVALARQAARRVDAPEDQIVEACLRVERYFSEALPLHVADEEQSVLPRIRGRSEDIDSALETMQGQHTQHEPKLRALLAASVAVREAPQDPDRRASLTAAAEQLEREFDEHLALEEAIIFPAIRRLLSSAVQAEMIKELRGRRGVHLA